MSLWCFIACFPLACCLVSGQNAKYVLAGEKVNFIGFSDIKEYPADILWKHTEGNRVQKVVHFDSSQEQFFGSYEGRITLSWRSADLSISNLRYEDSGSYDLEILINNQHMTKKYELIVIDRVTKPTIFCEINNASPSESAGKATLLCSLPSHPDQSSLTFQWSTNGKIDLGHMLKISLGGEFDDRQYNCTVNNPLTQESAVFIAKDCYPETKAQAGLIAVIVVVAVIVVLLLILMGFCCLKKVCSNREKSDLETQSNPGFPKATSDSEETQVLLDRAPTLPSKHALGHLNQRNDSPWAPSQRDSVKSEVQDSEIPFSPPVKQLRAFFEKENGKANEAEPKEVVEEEVLEDNPSDSETMNPELIALSPESNSEKNKVQDSEIPFSPPVKQLRALFKTENGKANEAEPKKVVEEEVLEDNPSDSETMNPELIALSPESNSEKNKVQDSEIPFSPPVKQLRALFKTENGKANEAEPKEVVEEEVLEDNPSDSETMNPELIALSPESSPEKNKDEDNKASHRPPVPQKSTLVRNLSALQKPTENTNLKVIKKQGLDDPAESGTPNEVSNDQNSGSKKVENEFAKSTPENDVQPPPVARENSPLSQNSPESSPKAEHKQDINSDECAVTSSGESSSSSLEESEDEEQVLPASTPKKTDSEITVE